MLQILFGFIEVLFSLLYTVFNNYIALFSILRQLPIPILFFVGCILAYIGFSLSYTIDQFGYSIHKGFGINCTFSDSLGEIIEKNLDRNDANQIAGEVKYISCFMFDDGNDLLYMFFKTASLFVLVLFTFPPISALISRLFEFIAQQ